MFLVQIKPEGSINDLKSITGIFHRSINWEPLKKQEFPQCHRCKGFFHSASNCFLEPQFNKCDQIHEIGECRISNNEPIEREKLFCVNCKKYGHPATYRGCEVFKKLKQNYLENIATKRQNNNNKYSVVNKNSSYANTLRNNSLYVNNNNDLFQNLQNSLQNIATQISNLQKQLKSQEDRINALYLALEINN